MLGLWLKYVVNLMFRMSFHTFFITLLQANVEKDDLVRESIFYCTYMTKYFTVPT